jgi:hypothetical protein
MKKTLQAMLNLYENLLISGIMILSFLTIGILIYCFITEGGI